MSKKKNIGLITFSFKAPPGHSILLLPKIHREETMSSSVLLHKCYTVAYSSICDLFETSTNLRMKILEDALKRSWHEILSKEIKSRIRTDKSKKEKEEESHPKLVMGAKESATELVRKKMWVRTTSQVMHESRNLAKFWIKLSWSRRCAM